LIGGGGSKFLNFFCLSAATAARDFKIFFACRRRRLGNSKMKNSFENKKIPVYFNI
jgi:hypothetical protein